MPPKRKRAAVVKKKAVNNASVPVVEEEDPVPPSKSIKIEEPVKETNKENENQIKNNVKEDSVPVPVPIPVPVQSFYKSAERKAQVLALYDINVQKEIEQFDKHVQMTLNKLRMRQELFIKSIPLQVRKMTLGEFYARYGQTEATEMITKIFNNCNGGGGVGGGRPSLAVRLSSRFSNASAFDPNILGGGSRESFFGLADGRRSTLRSITASNANNVKTIIEPSSSAASVIELKVPYPELTSLNDLETAKKEFSAKTKAEQEAFRKKLADFLHQMQDAFNINEE